MAKAVNLRDAAPVFVVDDVKRSLEHYRKALGFRVEFTHGDPASYAGIERDNVTLHLQTARDSRRKAGHSAIYVFVTDVDELHRELKSRGARIVNEPRDYPYGMRDFDVQDLDGNSLCFGAALGSKK
jgi:uncharacterized glyoxalase superfamily protein PhnB